MLITILLSLEANFVGQTLTTHLVAGQQDASNPEFAMSGGAIHMPESYFVLVRRSGFIGAIRFLKIEQNNCCLGRSSYESYFQKEGSGAFVGSNVIRRSGEIQIKPMKGFSHSTMWQPGQNKLYVGSWWFGCPSPSLVNMSKHFSSKDEGFEFSPTSAQSVEEIDLSDKRIKWFRYDPNRRISLKVAELPK